MSTQKMHSSEISSSSSRNMICNICLEKHPISEGITLKCDHWFCKACLLKDWKTKIKAHQIAENILKCPQESCGKGINYYDLKSHLPEDLFVIYDQLKKELFIPLDTNEKTITCPKCSVYSIINKEAQYFTCPVCKIQYCANENCFGLWEKHKGLNCKLYRTKYKNKERASFSDTESFDKYAIERKLRDCPKCGAKIEKIKACNYVTCESMRCQKKTTFCYICGEILIGEQMKTHYTENNAFLLCEKKRENELKKLQFEKSKENIKCPLCGNKQSETLKLNIEENYKIIKCNSKTCRESYSCLICQQKVDINNDKKMMAHFPGLCLEKQRISNLNKKKKNPIKCPGCENNDYENFELPENFNNKILICKSKDCKNKTYCLSCKINIQNEDINKHLDCPSRRNSEFDVNWKPPKTKDFEMEQIDYKRKGQQMKYQEDEFLINSNSLEKNSIGENNIYHRNFEIIPADSKFPLEEKKERELQKQLLNEKKKPKQQTFFEKNCQNNKLYLVIGFLIIVMIIFCIFILKGE